MPEKKIDDDQILQEYAAGRSVWAIHTKLKVSTDRIKRVLGQHKPDTPKHYVEEKPKISVSFPDGKNVFISNAHLRVIKVWANRHYRYMGKKRPLVEEILRW